MITVKYPNVTVQVSGTDGNAFGILGKVMKAMRKAGLTKEQIDEYQKEATSGDYNHLLKVTMETVDAY